jgi:hypothetical protein
MHMRAIVVASLLLSSCYKDKPRTEGPPPGNGAPPAAARIDYSATIADPLGFLPLDSELVIGVDVDQLKKSMFWPPVAAKISQAGGSSFTSFKAICGFDPMQTVRAMSLGIKNIGQKTPDGVLVVHGLDRAALMACMEKGAKSGGKIAIENGIVVITSDDGSAVAFAFVDASTVVGVIGATASAGQLKAVLAAGSPLRGSAAFGELVGKTNLEASGWMVMNGNASVFDQMAGAVGSRPKAAFGSVSVISGVSMDLHLRLDTAAQAQQLSTMANNQAGMARAMFTRLDITTDAADVVVQLAMTDQQLSNLLQMAGVSLAAP